VEFRRAQAAVRSHGAGAAALLALERVDPCRVYSPSGRHPEWRPAWRDLRRASPSVRGRLFAWQLAAREVDASGEGGDRRL